jgi:hypothetical protein
MTLGELKKKVLSRPAYSQEDEVCRHLSCHADIPSGGSIYYLEASDGCVEEYCSVSCLLRDHTAKDSSVKRCYSTCVLDEAEVER